MTQRTAAILFADVAGSSRLYKSMGDDRAEQLINAILAEMSALTREHGGAVIKTIGDEIMAGFVTAEAAIRTAMAIHRARRSAPPPRINVHIGVHYGQTLVREHDVFGEAVNDAAHLVRIARAGQIVTSAEVVDSLPDELKERAVRFERLPLKGARQASDIYLISWDEATNTESTSGVSTKVVSTLPDLERLAVATARLELTYQDVQLTVGLDDLPVVVGRDPELATLPVRSHVASRDHFRIHYRRGKFVLSDNSTNGTWVQMEGQASPIFLRREELPLTKGGTIGIGRPASEDDPHRIRFRL